MSASVPTSGYAIRHARPEDIAACVILRGRTRENAISVAELAARGVTEASWRADVASGRLSGYLALAGDEIVGYCFGDRETGEIVVLALLPAHEGRGLGRALLQKIVDHLQRLGFTRLFLEAARDPQLRSHGFYRHMGWRPSGRHAPHGDEELELYLGADR